MATGMDWLILSPVADHWRLSTQRPWSQTDLPSASHSLGVAVYSPLARGILSGKYQPGSNAPPDTRAGRSDRRMMQTEWRPQSLEIAQALKAHAEKKGGNLIGLAVRWALNSEAVTAVIAGPRTHEQWETYIAALDYPWGADDEAIVDSLVPPGHPSTPGYTDPEYPVEGRYPRVK